MDIRLNSMNNVKRNVHLLKWSDLLIFPKYLTFWFLCLWTFYLHGKLRQYQFSLFILAILCVVGGIFIYEINPGYYNFPGRFRVTGKVARIFNYIIHLIPFFLISFNYDTKIKNDNGYLLIIVLVVYLMLNNPFYVYEVDLDEKILN